MKEYAYNAAVVFCHLVKDDQVLLIKRENPPTIQEYTVVGGKKEPGEDLLSACKREVLEETGLKAENLRLKGIVSNFVEGRDYEVTAYYFVSEDFSGEVTASDEGALEWCGIEQSYLKAGISDYYVRITPHVLNGKSVFLASIFTDRHGRITGFEVR